MGPFLTAVSVEGLVVVHITRSGCDRVLQVAGEAGVDKVRRHAPVGVQTELVARRGTGDHGAPESASGVKRRVLVLSTGDID